MIGVVYFAVLFALVHAITRRGGTDVVGACVATVLLGSPWLLGLLVMAFDRPGPLRNWVISSLLVLFSPALALHYDWTLARDYCQVGSLPSPLLILSLNLFFLGSYAVYWRAMGPQPCPSCHRRSLIPLMHLWGQTPRTSKTRWCASCGSLFWRIGAGPWQKERRRTWLDKPVDPFAGLDDTAATEASVAVAASETSMSAHEPLVRLGAAHEHTRIKA
jgi:hypothetical protein